VSRVANIVLDRLTKDFFSLKLRSTAHTPTGRGLKETEGEGDRIYWMLKEKQPYHG